MKENPYQNMLDIIKGVSINNNSPSIIIGKVISDLPNIQIQYNGIILDKKDLWINDYYIPDIRLKNPNIRLGKWGRMRREYLRQAHPILFSDMVLTETLYEHCAEVEATAKSHMELIVPQLMKHYGVTEQLKAENQMEWVRQINACVAQAEETIKAELIYC